MKKITTIAALLFLIVSCGEVESNKETATNENSKEVSTSAAVVSFNSPCELISEEEVKSVFAIPTDLAIKFEDRVLTYPTCSFEWEDGKVQMKMESLGMEIDIPSELMVVMAKNSNDKMFETSTKVYKDGVPINGVGDMAAWGESMLQLSFLSNGYMFHVHLKAFNDAEANKAKAIEIAHLLIEKL